MTLDTDVQCAMMSSFATALDTALNGGDAGDKTGFVLMVFPLNVKDGSCNYISNVDRNDVLWMLEQQLERFRGKVE